MKLEKILEKLSRSELSNLAIGLEGSGEIEERNKLKIIGYINDALLQIHSRFILRERSVIIELMDHVTNYHLLPSYAKSSNDSKPTYRYIRDSECEPFIGDVLKILSVWNSNGMQMVLNDSENPFSLFTPQPDTLQVPQPKQGMALAISYQANHPEVTDDPDMEVDVPVFLISPLTNYVAHLVFEHMNGQEHLAKSQNHLAIYERLCEQIEEKDLVNSSVSTTLTKFQIRGFA
jgi:hypothetical protein